MVLFVPLAAAALNPLTFNANVVAVGVVKPVVRPNVPAVPDRFKVVKAFDETEEYAPQLAKVTAPIVPAKVALPAFKLFTVTAPLVTATTPVTAGVVEVAATKLTPDDAAV